MRVGAAIAAEIFGLPLALAGFGLIELLDLREGGHRRE
jgi:hypothetical protein